MNRREKIAALLKEAREIVEKAQGEKRSLTDDEQTKVNELVGESKTLKTDDERDEKSRQIVSELGDLGRELSEKSDENGPSGGKAVSLGEHFVKHAGESLKSRPQGSRFSFGAPEFDMKALEKAAVTTSGLTQIQYLPNVVQLPLRRPVVADLLLSGTMSGTSLQYFVEGAVTGNPATVAENAAKPEVSGTFTPTTETLRKIAGWTKESDELLEDFPALVSIINGRLAVRLGIVEEDELLNGDGTGTHLTGLLNRSGLQAILAGTSTGIPAVLRAMTAIQTATFETPDFLVINPADYQTARLATDANGQYFGGGPFYGEYGNGGVASQPPLWGLRTVVTPAIAAGTSLVGTSSAAQVFRKGGVRIDTANTDQDDFINNRVTVRIEERLTMAVYRPAAFCTLTW